MMKLVRIAHDGGLRYGIVEGDSVTLVAGDPFSAWRADGEVPLAGAQLVCPVQPSKVVCVGLNYRTHIAEMGNTLHTEPVIFLKPPTAVIGPAEPIVMPKRAGRVDYEGELAIVIGKKARKVPAEEAAEHVLGYTCGNDVTARRLQHSDGQWTRAKSFDTFCPLGPWVVDVDPSDLMLQSLVNGEVRQQAPTSDMLFGPHELVSFVSDVMTLLPGDVIMTGTPGGIGELHDGDSVEVRIEGIGSLVNPVTGEG
jgi:2-keto-4-pentenoate hydratase/2-oxohepta-3-ene-1,7-dioic acid hydratase in catechol pathway